MTQRLNQTPSSLLPGYADRQMSLRGMVAMRRVIELAVRLGLDLPTTIEIANLLIDILEERDQG